MLPVLITLLGTFFIESYCLANDTVSAEYAGQIKFIKESDVSIQKEILELTSEKDRWQTLIRVTYLMKNESNSDKELQISFPLPLIRNVAECINGFSSAAPSCVTPEMRLFVNDQIVSGDWDVRLESEDKKYFTRIPYKELPGLDNDSYCDEPGSTQVFETITNIDGTELGKTPKAHGPPCNKTQKQNCEILKKETKQGKCESAINSLRLNRVYQWKYLFPKHKVIKILHEYRAGRGSDAFNASEFQNSTGDNSKTFSLKNKKDPFCLSDLGKDFKSETFLPTWTAYVLKTGANWKGPIRHFELVINKNDNEIVSTCFPGIKKVGPTQFRSVIKDFTPEDDLLVGYFIKNRSK